MKKETIVLIIVGLVAFVIGGGLGIYIQSQEFMSGANNIKKIIEVTQSKKVIPSIPARGQITNVFGRTITLIYAGESLAIPINKTAKITSMAAGVGTSFSQTKDILISDIKVGDAANISLNILQDGTIEGESVVVFPKR